MHCPAAGAQKGNALAGTFAVQSAQLGPHFVTLSFLTHAPPQAWKPLAQAMAQAPSTQVGRLLPLVGPGQTVPQPPQLLTSVPVSTQVALQQERPPAQSASESQVAPAPPGSAWQVRFTQTPEQQSPSAVQGAPVACMQAPPQQAWPRPQQTLPHALAPLAVSHG